jgi:hypothetical protein
VKNFEAITYAFGSADTSLGGFHMTRLTAAAVKPQDPSAAIPTTFTVESVYGWPSEGRVAVQGTLYRYTSRTDTSLAGIAWFDGATWRDGIKRTHQSFEDVWDQSNRRSLIDQIKRNVFVETAEGQYLDALARNVGIRRRAWVTSDDLFRRIVQAIAFSPRGSLWCIEALMAAILGKRTDDDGAPRWDVWENLVLDENGRTVDGGVVFIDLGPEFVSLDPNTSLGKTFVEDRTLVPMSSSTTFTLPFDPLDVTSVQAAPDAHISSLGSELPSAELITEYPGATEVPVWVFDGSGEASKVSPSPLDGGCVIIRGNGAAAYNHPARVDAPSIASLRAILSIEGGLNANWEQFVLGIDDGEKSATVGFAADGPGYSVSLIDSSGNPIGTPHGPLELGRYADIHVLHDGNNQCELYVDGRMVQQVEHAQLPDTVERRFRFGSPASSPGLEARIKQAQYFAESPTEFGEAGITVSGAAVSLGAPVPDFERPVMSVRASRVYSAQLLEDETVVNEVIDLGPPQLWRYYPFYLSDALNLIQEYVNDTVTAAGVQARYRVQVPRRRIS